MSDFYKSLVKVVKVEREKSGEFSSVIPEHRQYVELYHAKITKNIMDELTRAVHSGLTSIVFELTTLYVREIFGDYDIYFSRDVNDSIMKYILTYPESPLNGFRYIKLCEFLKVSYKIYIHEDDLST